AKVAEFLGAGPSTQVPSGHARTTPSLVSVAGIKALFDRTRPYRNLVSPRLSLSLPPRDSLLHHIDLGSTRGLLQSLPVLLSPDGQVQITEMYMPVERLTLCRVLANADRGNYYRPIEDWKEIFCEHVDPVVFEPFSQRHVGTTLFEMVYFKG